MLAEFIIGSAVVLGSIFAWCRMRDPALRDRIERPKHEFLRQVREFNNAGPHGQ